MDNGRKTCYLNLLFINLFSEIVGGLTRLPVVCQNATLLPHVPQLHPLLFNKNISQLCVEIDVDSLGGHAMRLWDMLPKDEGKGEKKEIHIIVSKTI